MSIWIEYEVEDRNNRMPIVYHIEVTFSIKRTIPDILKYCKVALKEFNITNEGYTLEATLKDYLSIDGRSILFTYLDVYSKYIISMKLWKEEDAHNTS